MNNSYIVQGVSVHHSLLCIHTCTLLQFTAYKQLLDEVFVISRIIKVEVGVISRSRRLRLITLTETLITGILDITKTESNNCFIIHLTKKKVRTVFASSLTASNTKRANLT